MLFRYQLSGDEDGDPLWKPDSTEADLEEHEGFFPAAGLLSSKLVLGIAAVGIIGLIASYLAG